MHVFVTGASGFVGSAVVRDLVAAGHRVTGLARSDRAAAIVTASGGAVRRGDLTDLAGLREAADAADGVVHTGYIHDFADMAGAAAVDRAALEAFGDTLAGSDRPLVAAAGIAFISPGRVPTEDDRPERTDPPAHPRVSEPVTLGLAGRGIRASVVRLAPTVHGEGDGGFVPRLVEIARERGVSAHVGDGAHRWCAVHRFDAARLFRLALEQAPAGSVWHGAAEEGVPMAAIAAAIADGLGVPHVSIAPEQAATHFGWLSFVTGADVPGSGTLTRSRLGWTPTGPTLLDDIATHYVTAVPAAR